MHQDIGLSFDASGLNAQSILDKAREAQKLSGLTLKGMSALTEGVRSSVRTAIDEVCHRHKTVYLPFAVPLMEKFEEMCRRRHIKIDDQVRVTLTQLLLNELRLNHRSIPMNPKDLISFTVLHGDAGSRLKRSFPAFHKYPYIFRQAVIHNSSDPFRFLEDVQAKIKTVSESENYKIFHDYPGMIRTAVMYHHADVTLFLDRVKEDVLAIQKEQEFSIFKNNQGLLIKVAYNHRNARQFLRKALLKIDELCQKPELKEFKLRNILIQYAVFNHPAAAETFVNNAHNHFKTLSREREFREFKKKPKSLLRGILSSPQEPRLGLRRMMARRQCSL